MSHLRNLQYRLRGLSLSAGNALARRYPESRWASTLIHWLYCNRWTGVIDMHMTAEDMAQAREVIDEHPEWLQERDE